MKTWQTDDKEWMKQRRAKWKEIQIRVNQLEHRNAKDKQVAKKFFLTGESDPAQPIEMTEVGALYEMWLHPDHSLERWEEVRDRYLADRHLVYRYHDSISDFLRGALNLVNPENNGLGPEESFFDGLEEQFFYFFKLNEFSKINESKGIPLTEEQLLKKAQSGIAYVRSFHNYLRTPNPNPYLITRWKVPYWHEAMLIACEGDFLGLEWMIEELCAILNNPQERHPLVVEMAEKIDEVLKDPNLKEGCKQHIQELREQYGCRTEG